MGAPAEMEASAGAGLQAAVVKDSEKREISEKNPAKVAGNAALLKTATPTVSAKTADGTNVVPRKGHESGAQPSSIAASVVSATAQSATVGTASLKSPAKPVLVTSGVTATTAAFRFPLTNGNPQVHPKTPNSQSAANASKSTPSLQRVPQASTTNASAKPSSAPKLPAQSLQNLPKTNGSPGLNAISPPIQKSVSTAPSIAPQAVSRAIMTPNTPTTPAQVLTTNSQGKQPTGRATHTATPVKTTTAPVMNSTMDPNTLSKELSGSSVANNVTGKANASQMHMAKAANGTSVVVPRTLASGTSNSTAVVASRTPVTKIVNGNVVQAPHTPIAKVANAHATKAVRPTPAQAATRVGNLNPVGGGSTALRSGSRNIPSTVTAPNKVTNSPAAVKAVPQVRAPAVAVVPKPGTAVPPRVATHAQPAVRGAQVGSGGGKPVPAANVTAQPTGARVTRKIIRYLNQKGVCVKTVVKTFFPSGAVTTTEVQHPLPGVSTGQQAAKKVSPAVVRNGQPLQPQTAVRNAQRPAAANSISSTNVKRPIVATAQNLSGSQASKVSGTSQIVSNPVLRTAPANVVRVPGQPVRSSAAVSAPKVNGVVKKMAPAVANNASATARVVAQSTVRPAVPVAGRVGVPVGVQGTPRLQQHTVKSAVQTSSGMQRTVVRNAPQVGTRVGQATSLIPAPGQAVVRTVQQSTGRVIEKLVTRPTAQGVTRAVNGGGKPTSGQVVRQAQHAVQTAVARQAVVGSQQAAVRTASTVSMQTVPRIVVRSNGQKVMEPATAAQKFVTSVKKPSPVAPAGGSRVAIGQPLTTARPHVTATPVRHATSTSQVQPVQVVRQVAGLVSNGIAAGSPQVVRTGAPRQGAMPVTTAPRISQTQQLQRPVAFIKQTTGVAPTPNLTPQKRKATVPPEAMAAAIAAAKAVAPTPPLQPRGALLGVNGRALATPPKVLQQHKVAPVPMAPRPASGKPVAPTRLAKVVAPTPSAKAVAPAPAANGGSSASNAVRQAATPEPKTPTKCDLKPADVPPGMTFADGEHVTMWNRLEKRKIAGNAAPLGKNVRKYLREHSECEVYVDQDESRTRSSRKRPKTMRHDRMEEAPGDHVPIWNTVEKRKIAGNAAPLAKNLDKYFRDHPNCVRYDFQDIKMRNQAREERRLELERQLQHRRREDMLNREQLGVWGNLNEYVDQENEFKTEYERAAEMLLASGNGNQGDDDVISPLVMTGPHTAVEPGLEDIESLLILDPSDESFGDFGILPPLAGNLEIPNSS